MIDLDNANETRGKAADNAAGKDKVCCYLAGTRYVDERTGEFELIMVTRNQPGYAVVATYAGLADAEHRAAGLNDQGGIDEATKRDIICSAIAAVAANRTRGK